MEKRKIGFSGFEGYWPGFNREQNLFTDILRERFEIEVSDDPDYLIVSPLGPPFSYMKYDCVRILYTGEPLVPDFNVFDYAIGFDYLRVPDVEGSNRYYRFPLCFYDVDRVKEISAGMTLQEAKEALQEKKYFCNFIYSHHSAKGKREEILEELQRYKRVECAGSFMNNMANGEVVSYPDGKLDFLRLCKFTVACESVRYPGFITEKIVHPMFARSVPIYYGSPRVGEEFNPEAVIVLTGDSVSLEEGIEKVIRVDQDDELYIKMLMAPKLISDSYLDNMYEGLRQFLFHIFDQDKETAYRRLRLYIQGDHEFFLKDYSIFYGSQEYKIMRKMLRLHRRINRHLRLH